ncbi:MAG: hypothetical protein INR62_03340 [Rhodospirillales bacterium]|nr:hypothetical protein [Acetobacter sp.]
MAFNPANNTLYVADANHGTIRTFNASTGAATTTGFTSPTGLNGPERLAVAGSTLFVTNLSGHSLGAYNLATGAAVPGFTPITGLSNPVGVAVYGNDLFVAIKAEGKDACPLFSRCPPFFPRSFRS